MMIGKTPIDMMIEEIVTDKRTDETIIGKVIEWTITQKIIGQIMEETTNRDIELEVNVGRILEIIKEIIQERDLIDVEI